MTKTSTIGKLLIGLSVSCGILGVLSNWREYNYRKATIVAKASIVSVDIKPKSGKAMASVDYVIIYEKDNAVDTLTYTTTEEFSADNPLPSVEELKAHDVYVHYVPINRQSDTSFRDRLHVSGSQEIEASFSSKWFTFSLVILVLTYLLSPNTFRKKL
jgi:ribosomal protein S8E